MGNFSKWQKEGKGSGILKCVLFVSRNKDNKGVEDFTERRKSFMTSKTVEELKQDFISFAQMGKKGETSRLYMSVNSRDNAKIQKALIHELIDKEISIQSLPAFVTGIAAQKENKAENKWLFDYDEDIERIDEFVSDIYKADEYTPSKKEKLPLTVEVYKTPNGCAVITNRGFDTRGLLEKWKDVTLKRDDMICCYWITVE